jgi:hypothetical protein
MKLGIVSGMGVLAAALSAAALASEPRVLPPILDEIIVTAKRPQIEEIIVTARRPRELLAADSDVENAPVEAPAEAAAPLRPEQPQGLF